MGKVVAISWLIRHEKASANKRPRALECLSMIQTMVTHPCPSCGSQEIVKNGHDYQGSQKFHCKSCQRYGTLGARVGKSPVLRQQVYRAVQERMSWRGIECVFGLSRRTVRVEQWIVCIPKRAASLSPAVVDDVLELDELWSSVGSKSEARWLWVALWRRTRPVVACYLGDPSKNSARDLWLALPAGYRHLCFFKPIAMPLMLTITSSLTKRPGKPPMLSVASRRSVKCWYILPAKPLLFPSVWIYMMAFWSALSITTILLASVNLSPLPHFSYISR